MTPDILTELHVSAKDDALPRILDAAEEWADDLDAVAERMMSHGPEGRNAAKVYTAEASEIRAAILLYRPLRQRDPDTGDWVEP